jgi:hypothetical protein
MIPVGAPLSVRAFFACAVVNLLLHLAPGDQALNPVTAVVGLLAALYVVERSLIAWIVCITFGAFVTVANVVVLLDSSTYLSANEPLAASIAAGLLTGLGTIALLLPSTMDWLDVGNRSGSAEGPLRS